MSSHHEVPTLIQTAGQASGGTLQATLDGRQSTPAFSMLSLKTKTKSATSKSVSEAETIGITHLVDHGRHREYATHP
tara:strand:- start:283 stop:513 length:231 start_codon:yes stop_codon:yes gene_type:complete